MKISYKVYQSILKSHITTTPEQGGIIGEKDDKIVAYFHDVQEDIPVSRAEYVPNVELLNEKICEWSNDGIKFAGIIHGHPRNENTLSNSDMEYITEVFELYENGTRLFFPIVVPGGIVIPYAITKKEAGLAVVQEEIDIFI